MSIQAMKQALEFVEKLRVPKDVLQVMLQIQDGERVITTLRTAISEQEKCEPVAFQHKQATSWVVAGSNLPIDERSEDWTPLYSNLSGKK